MHKDLFEEFRRFEGQPVRIFTDDSRIIEGIVFCAGENTVRVLRENGDVSLIEFCHIDSVEEPMMRLHRRCNEAIDVRQVHGHERCCLDQCCFEDDGCRREHRKDRFEDDFDRHEKDRDKEDGCCRCKH